VYIHDIGKNAEKKVGALNYGYSMIAPFDYVLGVDGDTVAEPDAVATLLKEIESGPKIGGVSAIFTVDDSKIKGPIASWLVAGQRAQFAAFNIKAMQHHRVIPVLGGQFSLFSVRALEEVAKRENQATPWIMKSEVEDSLLSLQIKSAGYETMLSASARAYVGGMTTLRSLDGQQVKWNSGAVELMRSNPRHPSLTQRWMEHISMFFNGYNRFAFAFLLIASLSISAFEFYPIWIAPTVVAILLNLKIALKIRSRNFRDILFAVLFVPAELYLWVRIGHFVRSWWKSLFGGQSDNWAAQAKAERGRGNAYLVAPIIEVLVLAVCLFVQFKLPIAVQTAVILPLGWWSLAVLTVTQTCIMLVSLLRPTHGAKV
jgi:cellulose synthase/poly-beta-1,6-N-acetylglucosamine synthase-like glycosyltransferase